VPVTIDVSYVVVWIAIGRLNFLDGNIEAARSKRFYSLVYKHCRHVACIEAHDVMEEA